MYKQFLPTVNRHAGIVRHELPECLISLADGIEIQLPDGLFQQAEQLAILRRSFHRTQKQGCTMSPAQALMYPARLEEAKNLAGDVKGMLGELAVREYLKQFNIQDATLGAPVEYQSQNSPDLTFSNGVSVDIKTASTVCSLTAQCFEGGGADDKFVAVGVSKHISWKNRFPNFEGYLTVYLNIVEDVALSAKLLFVPNNALLNMSKRNVGYGEFYQVKVEPYASDNRGLSLRHAQHKLLTEDCPKKDESRKPYVVYAAWLRSLVKNEQLGITDEIARELLKLFKPLCIKAPSIASQVLQQARIDDHPYFSVGLD